MQIMHGLSGDTKPLHTPRLENETWGKPLVPAVFYGLMLTFAVAQVNFSAFQSPCELFMHGCMRCEDVDHLSEP